MEKFIGRYCPKCKLMVSDQYISWVGEYERSVILYPECMVCRSKLEARFEEVSELPAEPVDKVE